jgi:hypothetical protein
MVTDIRMTPNGALAIRCRPRPSCYCGRHATWSGRSSQGQVSLVSLMTQGGRRAHAWDDPVHEQPPKGGLSPVTKYDPSYRGQGLGAAFNSAPFLVLPGQWDARYERPYALCERHRALPEHGCVSAGAPRHLARVAGRGLLARGVSPTGVPRPGCCCTPLWARLKCERVGPGRQSEPLRLGTVAAGCLGLPGAVAAQRAARARWACGLALNSRSDRSRRVRSLAPRLGLRVHP